MFVNESGRNKQSLWRTFHRAFLPSFGSFGQAVSEEKIFKICQSETRIACTRAPTTLKSEGEVTSRSGADKREVRDNREKW